MTSEGREFLLAILEDPTKASEVPAAALPRVLGQVAEIQAVLLARLVGGGSQHSGPVKAAPAEADRLLTVAQACELFAVERRWLYRHAGQIQGARRLSRKCLRFTETGLRRYLEGRRA